MKYSVTATAVGYGLRRPLFAMPFTLSEAWRFALRNWGLWAALALTLAVHAPTLRYFFDGDDFVVLGNAEYSGTWSYLKDTFLMRDFVPNWRPLTAAVYAAEWRLFGLDARAWRAVNLSVHLASLALLYTLVTRVTRRQAIGAVAAVIFGVSGAHFDTVTYVTALPHVLATCFVLGSLLALVSYAQDGERNPVAYALAFVLFALAFLANEGAFVYAPVLATAYALFSRRWQRSTLRLALHVVPFAALASAWMAFYQTCSCEQIKFDDYYWGGHVFSNYAIYLSWLIYPARSIPGDPDALRWTLAGAIIVAALFFAIRGPQLARLCVAGIGLALLPFAPVAVWTASRYSYAAVAFFAPIAAIAGVWLFDHASALHRHARLPASILALTFVAAIAALYSWQTVVQDARSGRGTEQWRFLAAELTRNYEQVPAGTTIYIVDGPWQNPMWQYSWLPGVARALYGDAAAFDLPRAAFTGDVEDGDHVLYLEWTGERLQPIGAVQVRRDQ